MSSELFESRQEDYRHIYETTKRKLTEQLGKCYGETQKQLIREIERGIEEASILIQKMEGELRNAPLPYRSQMLGTLRTYKQDVEQLSRDLKRASSSGSTWGEGSRGNFGYSNSEEDVEASQRARLMQGTNVLGRASDSLARTHQVAAETDQIGTDIIDELGTQRESLVRTQTRLHETDANLSKSRKILNTMARRLMTNKMILIVIILLELGILGGVLYWRLRPKP